MSSNSSRLTRWLDSTSPAVFAAFAIGASFSTYFCMYAFRKPFSAATYEGYGEFLNVDMKTAFVISQIIGYALSKFIGIRFCSEISDRWRAISLVGMILFAEFALLLFGILPGNLKIFAIFLNGIPLGVVWGLVVRYLEGRHLSELLLAGLSCSYIVASGVVKDVGRIFIDNGTPDHWMPFVTGLCFLPLFLLSVWLLNQLPQPSQSDIASRHKRTGMDRRDRLAFFSHFWVGLTLLMAAYFLFTAFRDYRDNYGAEVLESLGYLEVPAIFSKTEFPVAVGVMIALAAINLIRNHRNGLIGTYGVMVFGLGMMIVSTLALDLGWLDGHEVWWMILVGLGSYLAYVPFGTALFERLIASTRVKGNAVFAIYLADAMGYTGSVTIQLFRDLGFGDVSRLTFLHHLTYVTAAAGIVLLIISLLSFLPKTYRINHEDDPDAESGATLASLPESPGRSDPDYFAHPPREVPTAVGDDDAQEIR